MKRSTWIVGGATVTLLAIGFHWFVNRPRLPEDTAARAARAIADGDAAKYLSLMHSEEVKRNKLTRQNLERLFAEVVRPAVSLIQLDKQIQSGNRYRQFGSSTINGTVSGVKATIGANSFVTDEGPRVFLGDLIANSFVIQWIHRHRKVPESPVEVRSTMLEGVWQNRALLRDLGIRELAHWNAMEGSLVFFSVNNVFTDPKLREARKTLGIPEGSSIDTQ